jgi:hypothetical protein
MSLYTSRSMTSMMKVRPVAFGLRPSSQQGKSICACSNMYRWDTLWEKKCWQHDDRCTLSPLWCAGRENGIQRVWLDGDKVLDKNNVRYAMEDGHDIKRFRFGNFHGGSTIHFEPNQTQFQWCDASHTCLNANASCRPGCTSVGAPAKLERCPCFIQTWRACRDTCGIGLKH